MDVLTADATPAYMSCPSQRSCNNTSATNEVTHHSEERREFRSKLAFGHRDDSILLAKYGNERVAEVISDGRSPQQNG